MNLRRKICFIALLIGVGLGGALGCGSNNPVSFTITPAGPTVVLRGATLQFDTNPTGLNVTWSVVGGAGNGTIDANGLYTAPSNLPIDNVVTIEADLSGDTDQATVNLQAADNLAFDAPEQVSDNPIPNAVGSIGILIWGVGDQIGAGLGSVHVYSSWTASTTDVAFSSALDLGAFSAETNLTGNGTSINNSMVVDQSLNPVIFYSSTGGALQMLKSSNQGGSFGTPVPIVSPASGNSEFMADAAVDSSNIYHLVYTEAASPAVVNYSESSDGGATWSAPIPLATSLNDQIFPQIAVSPDGQDIVVCYSDGGLGPSNIFVAISSNGGTSFTASDITNTAGPLNLLCNVALGPNGEVYVAYSADPAANSDILFQSSTDGGTTFNPPITVNSSTVNDQLLSFMAVDELGRIDMIWADDNGSGGPGGEQLMYSRSLDNGATFSANVSIVPLSVATFVIPMGLVHDESGRLHIQYGSDVNDVPGANYEIFYLNAQ